MIENTTIISTNIEQTKVMLKEIEQTNLKIKKLESENISEVNKWLEKTANKINIEIFRGTLKDFSITLQKTKKSYGHFTFDRSILINGKANHEININPVCFEDDNKQVITTLIHEMVHLYCFQYGIKDVSRQARYHNKNFKKYAEYFGLVTEQHPTIGTMTPKELQTMDFDKYDYIDFKDTSFRFNTMPMYEKEKRRNFLIDNKGDWIKLTEEDVLMFKKMQ